MAHPLDGCVSKLNRAYRHIQELKSEISRFHGAGLREADDYRVTFAELDPQTGENILRLKVLRQPDLLDWGVIAGDAIHNLRSSFDQLIEQLTIGHGGTPLSHTSFPVFSDPVRFKLLVRKGPQRGSPDFRSGLFQVRGVHPDAQAIIERMQPYHRADYRDHPLWLLHELWNMDKHRVVPVIGMISTRTTFFRLALVAPVEVARLHAFVPFEDGAEIGRLKLAPHQPSDAKVYLDQALSVLFDQAEPGLGKPVIPILEEMLCCAVGIVEELRGWVP